MHPGVWIYSGTLGYVCGAANAPRGDDFLPILGNYYTFMLRYCRGHNIAPQRHFGPFAVTIAGCSIPAFCSVAERQLSILPMPNASPESRVNRNLWRVREDSTSKWLHGSVVSRTIASDESRQSQHLFPKFDLLNLRVCALILPADARIPLVSSSM